MDGLKRKHKVDPMKELLVETVGRDLYRAKWESLSPAQRLWWTIRGENPGGRKGAPPLS